MFTALQRGIENADRKSLPLDNHPCVLKQTAYLASTKGLVSKMSNICQMGVSRRMCDEARDPGVVYSSLIGLPRAPAMQTRQLMPARIVCCVPTGRSAPSSRRCLGCCCTLSSAAFRSVQRICRRAGTTRHRATTEVATVLGARPQDTLLFRARS